jgi:hypothetical protein
VEVDSVVSVWQSTSFLRNGLSLDLPISCFCCRCALLSLVVPVDTGTTEQVNTLSADSAPCGRSGDASILAL